MKKKMCLLLAMVLLCGLCCPVVSEEDLIITDDDFFEDDQETEWTPYDYDHITVGNPTPLNGQFFTDLWGNGTSDTDVRHLVSGYNLVQWDSGASTPQFDRSVVIGALISDGPDGSRSYLLSLYSDLYYSDGTPITAWDYAFSALFQCSPLIAALGGHPAVYDYFVGYEDYIAGVTPYLAGVRVLSDRLIRFTVKGEALPYFYELARLGFYPYPIQAIAPGCQVFDDGYGAYIGNIDPAEATPLFTSALLTETVLAPETGYLVHPDPVSGPYQILSYDGSKAVFEINPYFKGNEAGKKPRIKRLTYTAADNETMIRDLREGAFTLLNKVTWAPSITEGLRLCAEYPQYTRSAYPRTGLTYILFNPSSAPVQEQKVRQAIHFCLDKPQFIRAYAGSFGLETEGLYGLGQWMTEAASGTMPYPVELPENASPAEIATHQREKEEWEAFTLDGLRRYEINVEEAVRLLEEAGWTLNERGEAYDPEKDDVRCKEIGGELRQLSLTMGYQPRADVEEAFAEWFIAPLAQAGVRLTLEPLDFDSIVEAHNEHDFGALDLLYFGDNFNVIFDPSLFFWQDEGGNTEDSLRSVYEEMFALSRAMDATEPKDLVGYMRKWILFQERLTELLPLIPVYTNVYFDFYTKELDEYWVEEHISWAKAIVPARMRSVSSQDGDRVDIDLSSADGLEEIDLSALLARPNHQETDYTEGALSVFPASVRRQVPPDYRTIYEFTAARLEQDIDPDTETLDLRFYFMTLYADGETVYLLFGIPGKGSDVEWFVQEGTALEDGSVGATLEKEQWEKLLGLTFALAVVSQ